MPCITREEAIRRHRLMWNWIADETERRGDPVHKRAAFKHFCWDKNDAQSTCWACTFAEVRAVSSGCHRCPLVWTGGYCANDDENGLYDQWQDAYWNRETKTAADLARQIANLPEKEELYNAT